jgi:selenocysteine lyase/cysteine desulfurase
VQTVAKVKLHTSLDPRYSCAICGVSIDGMTPGQLASALFDQYKIHTVGIVWENISCVRVTPHVYTRTADLDQPEAARRDESRVSILTLHTRPRWSIITPVNVGN